MPETVKSILDSLTPADRARLTYSFEHEIPQHIPLPNGRYIGVYAERLKNLNPETKVGHWSVGSIRNPK